ncbi:MAG: hypothetical protein QOF61_198 [Acidobacteriota bacterium]|nr:hypothetical protein [Acidobacteriota bacterium]
MSDVQEIYAQTVRQLPLQDRLRLAALILDEITTPANLTLNEAQRRDALAKLLRHAGAARSGDARSADNEQVDADLAREYAATHEGEG